MTKCAFYLHNASLEDKDFNGIQLGNPGVGGSEYEFLLVPYLLEQRQSQLEVWLLANFHANFPHEHVAYVSDLEKCCEYCKKKNIQTLVVDIKNFNDNILNKYNGIINIIIWAHNDPSKMTLDLYQQRDYVKRIVCCGREQMEMFRDHIATCKATYIYNIFPLREFSYYANMRTDGENHNVVYMGSLINTKGFHVLAKAWKSIISKVPDAQLYVIGSGRLYDKNAKLGSYNIASQEYEEEFMPGLVDENGTILPSVHFLGLLGDEKNKTLGICKVAVPNPTGLSECLPITSIEMQLMGCNIVTKRHQAYLDTVKNKDWLFKKERELTDYVVKRLLSPSDSHEELYNFVAENFSISENIERWEDVLSHPGENVIQPYSVNKYQTKWLKDFIRKNKTVFSVLNKLPLLRGVYAKLDNIFNLTT